jgi:hypothetical protein
MDLSLKIDNVVGNAFIELMKKDPEKREIQASILSEYGKQVLNLASEDDESTIIHIIISRHKTHEFLRNYSDFFDIKIEENPINETIFVLSPDKQIDDLRTYFRSGLPFPLIKAFMDERAVNILKT